MREIREKANTSTIEKIAIITAINTANQLLKGQATAGQGSAGNLGDAFDEDDQSQIMEQIESMQKRWTPYSTTRKQE